MEFDRKSTLRLPDATDIELACDADMNAKWKNADGNNKTAAERITLQEAELGAFTRPLDPEDRIPTSNN